MTFPRPRLNALAAAVMVLSALSSASAQSIRLTRWEGPAVLIAHHAPGIAYFRLTAVADWPKDAWGGPLYQLQLVLPDGQTETRPIPEGEISARRLMVLVRATAVRNLRPSDVRVIARVLDAATGAVVSDDLVATIDDFPHPRPASAALDPGPFGWGEPLDAAPDKAKLLPRPGPDGFTFVRVPASGDEPGFLIASTEASNAQVAKRLPGYDPRAGRSDEFTLEDPAQPAVGLSAARAQEYLAALSKADRSGLTHRLPTPSEWLRAARAGRSSAFWWGDEPSYPAGANFLGPEPALPNDTTAPVRPAEHGGPGGFEPNPWGLFHTFGNVAEWASAAAAPDGASSGFVRLGGHFRTEPAAPLPEVAVENGETTGPDPYVGVRPLVALTAESGADLIRKALRGNTLLADVQVSFDPDRATATLRGRLTDSAARRAADRRLEPLWFLAAVENLIETPAMAPGQLAELGTVAGPVRRITPLGRWIYVVPVSVRWAPALPVSGSEWWVNVYMGPGGPGSAGCASAAYKLVEREPNDTPRIDVLIRRDRLATAGLPPDAPVSVALSLGAPAPNPTDPHVVSNVASILWSAQSR